MRVSDHIANLLADHGITHVFAVAGGSSLFLIDSFCLHPSLKVVFCHHEQACAMAADAYYRVNGKLACVCVTSGPGGLNALNGVFGAWVDSIPMLVISGQVRRETIHRNHRLRQLGDQECAITALASTITKSVQLVPTAEEACDAVDYAIQTAKNRRCGPAWVDVPVDVQAIDLDAPRYAISDRFGKPFPPHQDQIDAVIEMLMFARSPVIVGGTGVRLAGACEAFGKLANHLGIPTVTAWNHDTMRSDHRCFIGRQGTLGDRSGNIAVQNADMLLVIGSRLGVRHTSLNWQTFAPKCHDICWVDIDEAEFSKPTIISKKVHGIKADAKDFCEMLLKAMPKKVTKFSHWLQWCQVKRIAYMPKTEQWMRKEINPYHFLSILWNHLRDDDVVVCADASATIITGHVALIRGDQRILSNSGCASMGWDLPAAIGAAFARGGKRIICLAGDGSMQLNIQELATIRQHNLPIKLFVLNNGGYLSIRSSQNNLGLTLNGESNDSGLFFPNLMDIARAYSIPYVRLHSPDSLHTAIGEQLEDNSFLFMTEVMLDPDQGFEPRMQSKLVDDELVSSTLDNMYPFLSAKEQAENVYTPPEEWSSRNAMSKLRPGNDDGLSGRRHC